MLAPWKKNYDQPRQHIKKQRHYFTNKGLSSQSYGFSSSYIWIWKLDYKESWVPKNWCFWTVVMDRTLESHLDCKEIQPVHPKGNQSWIFIGRTDAEAETSILWPHDVKNWLFGKDPDAGKDWRQGEKGTTEAETVGQHHQLDGHEFEQAPGVGDGQGRLACCSPWGHKVSDMTEWLNWPRAHPLAVSCGVTKCLSLPGLRRPQTEGLGHRTFSAKMKTHRQIRTHGSSQLSGPLSCFSALTTSENMSCWLPGLYPIDWLMSIHENVLWKQSPSCIIYWLQGFEQRIQYLWVSNFSSLKWDWDILCVRYDILHVTYLMR